MSGMVGWVRGKRSLNLGMGGACEYIFSMSVCICIYSC